MDILSKTKATIEQAKQWAKQRNATELFISLASTYYSLCEKMGVNFSVAYSQFAKETGYGKFGGVLDETYCNPCGLKNHKGGGDKDKNAHCKFTSWEEGIQAHLEHLCLYAGQTNYPLNNPKDSRHFKYLLGTCTKVEDLGGKWCPNKNYGIEILKMVDSLENTKVVDMDNLIKIITRLIETNDNITKELLEVERILLTQNKIRG